MSERNQRDELVVEMGEEGCGVKGGIRRNIYIHQQHTPPKGDSMKKEVALDFFTNSNSRNNNTVFTIGYEGKDITNFTTVLRNNKIKTLIDIREIPLSRKKGFSKTKLEQNIKQKGINYFHFKELGSPRELRKKLWADKDFNFFSRKYSKHIKTKESLLRLVHQRILSENCCLMCFEKDHELCHRSIVINEIKRIDNNGLKIKHL